MAEFLLTECNIVKRKRGVMGALTAQPEKLTISIEMIGSGNTSTITNQDIIAAVLSQLHKIKKAE
jgi:hypothetical protein